MAAFAALALGAFLYPAIENLGRWPLTVALRHLAAAPNCTFIQADLGHARWASPRLARPAGLPSAA
jgi:hypothetical protein